eukprot:Lithocolla_globosa_v1_NODE_7955_length_882_cov_8.951632.p1 type:complete len:238 gc:universal NODE_7955_length_882_cov_8.951632:130-843(+)
MGYCAQFDALFEHLTLAEHFALYGALKGFKADWISVRMEEYVTSMQIVEFQDTLSKNLSGGTKRKLSFGLAALAWPRLLVLDEPSTGLDPHSRRVLWDYMKHTQPGRASVLTTHSMDEAQALCSRIAILVKGELNCVGSPTHLKAKYGEGYRLEIKTKSDSIENVKQKIVHLFPESTLVEEFAGTLIYKVSDKSKALGDIFSALEKNKQEMEMEEYSFSQTTLEQVFISMAKKQEDQ